MLKKFKQLFSKPKIKSSAWDASGSGRRVMYWQGETLGFFAFSCKNINPLWIVLEVYIQIIETYSFSDYSLLIRIDPLLLQVA